MDELINKLKEITKLSDLENVNSINTNDLLYAIAKSGKYELLKDTNIRLNLTDKASLERLIDLLLSDEDFLYFMRNNGFTFTYQELNTICNIVFEKYQYSYEFTCFLRYFFNNNKELNYFVKEHETLFINCIKETGHAYPYVLDDCDNFTELILKGNHVELIKNLEKYSLSNLKLLAKALKPNTTISYYVGHDRFALHLFENKENLTPNEFIALLNILTDKQSYDIKNTDSETTLFTNLVSDNIEYLIDAVTQTQRMPKCLIESKVFRDECIKKNRIDLAVQCTLSPEILQNESLINAYCKELGIDQKKFYDRSKWLLKYYKKNNNIFNTLLATSLKDNIFIIKEEHFERFINDVDIQISLSKLNNKELMVLSKILNLYSYKEYDISNMIVNIINNINDYQELINSLNIENLTETDLRKLVSTLQLPNNQYQINDLESLQNYNEKKKQFFENNFNTNDLNSNKDNLLKTLFNIDLTEAQYINYKYCQDERNNNILDNLKNSELPPQIYNYLLLINRIIDCSNANELLAIYNNVKNANLYNSEIQLETYLRSKYTELYSKSLLKIEEIIKKDDQSDSFISQINYKGKNIQLCIPRDNLKLFVHCVGSCSLSSDVIDKNYKVDWMDRPQMQDHFVACSYINERGIFSIRSEGAIIFGFDTLEAGSILGMGNTDIDSIGSYSKSYDGSRTLQKENGNRAKFYVPSEILKTINDGYNEIVVERRNTDQSRSKELKRKPDYIIMMAESIEQDNLATLETLYQNELSFISDEDKQIIQQINSAYKLKDFLIKYKSIILQHAREQEIPLSDMANKYVDMIMNAKYYEDCLKASSEFDIPLVIVDKTYYFNKILSESIAYDEETKSILLTVYQQLDKYKKKELFNTVAKGQDVTKFITDSNIIKKSM